MKTLTLVSILLMSSLTFATEPAGHTVGNRLQPFTSDGCSWFPDGVPFLNKNKWLHCCIEHDVAYWKGGTSEQKKTADENLGQCVGKTGEGLIGKAMALGVRGGGAAALPTTSHWGYGWVQERGYGPLNEDEQNQVAALTPQLRGIVEAMKIQTPPLIPLQTSITKNLCADRAIEDTESFLGSAFHLIRTTESRQQKVEGTLLKVSLEFSECKNPTVYEFLLLRPDACEVVTNVLSFRAHVVLHTPKLKCEPRD